MDVADRVNLGLIPTSESGWLTACAALRRDVGGVLHVHAAVNSKHSIASPGTERILPSNSSVSVPHSNQGKKDTSSCRSLEYEPESSDNKNCKICEQRFTGDFRCKRSSLCQHSDGRILPTSSDFASDSGESRNGQIFELGPTSDNFCDSLCNCSTAAHLSDRVHANRSSNFEPEFTRFGPEKMNDEIAGQTVVMYTDSCSSSGQPSNTVSPSSLSPVDIAAAEKSALLNRAAQNAATVTGRISPSNPAGSVHIAAKSRMTKFSKTCCAKPAWCKWAVAVCRTLESHLCGMQRCDWSAVVRHIEHVKSYAPHVDHVIADIECRPPEVAQK